MQETMLDIYTHRAEHSTVSLDPLKKSPKPEGFDCAYITAQKIAYERCGSDGRPTGDGGVLPEGKIVWGSPSLMTDGLRSQPLPVYADAAGTVLLNPKLLRVFKSPIAGQP